MKKIKKLFDLKELELSEVRKVMELRRKRKNSLDAGYRRKVFLESVRNPLKWRREEPAKVGERLEIVAKRLKAQEKESG